MAKKEALGILFSRPRVKMNITLRTVARLTRLSATTIHSIENCDITDPQFGTMVALSEFYEIDMKLVIRAWKKSNGRKL